MTNLHAHSEYSLLDSIIKISELVRMSEHSASVTDHGTVSGWPDLYFECKRQNKKPIFGIEVYHVVDDETYHLTLLARNKVGASNLLALMSESNRFFKRVPRVTDELLEAHSEGVICLSGCIASYLAKRSLEGGKLNGYWRFLERTFDHVFYEVQNNGLDSQKRVASIYRSNKLPCVASFDSHYVYKDDAQAHDIALCIATNSKMSDERRLRFEGRYYIPSFEEASRWFTPEELSATDHVASLVESFDLFDGVYKLPIVDNADETLQLLVESKLKSLPAEYRDRAYYELDVIKKYGFSSYFLVLNGLCQSVDQSGHIRGWGRGSVCGSLVAYLLGITRIDPIRWGLHFERFLNPGRITMPDVDLDFLPDDRQAAIDWLSRLGSVRHIGSFGTLGTKEVLRSVCRVTGHKDELSSLVPDRAPQPTIEDMLNDARFRRIWDDQPQWFRYAVLRLANLKRNRSTHASGVVVGDVPWRLHNGTQTSEWDMHGVEAAGFVKFDILGLTVLEVLRDLQHLVRLEDIPLDDKATYDSLCAGETFGVFQWESQGYTELITRVKPDSFEVLMDINALYRPGCLESGITESYIKRRCGLEPITQIGKLELPMGLPLFQEDLMALAVSTAGFSLSDADRLRKAISKKLSDEFVSIRQMWLDGCARNGLSEDEALDIWSKLEKFARYAWNKSHAVPYTLLSYWTAYYSTHYPEHFCCALFNRSDGTKRLAEVAAFAARRGIKVLPPSLNSPNPRAFVENGCVKLGLLFVKGVGPKTVDSLIKGVVPKSIGRLFFMGEITDELGALGFRVSFPWWARLCKDAYWVLEVSKSKTKAGRDMLFVEAIDHKLSIRRLVVFSSLEVWRPNVFVLAKVEGDVAKRSGTWSWDSLVVHIRDGKGFSRCRPGFIKPNVYCGGPIGQIELDQDSLEWVNLNFGVEALSWM